MSVIAAALKHMLAAGMPHEDIIQAVADMEAGLQKDEQAERRRAADRDRKRQMRLRKSADSADTADVPRGRVTRVEDNLLHTDIEPLEVRKHSARARETTDFEKWWVFYPHKVQRGAAERAFPKARQAASLDDLIAGVHRYVASKPPDMQWRNPATWLNGKGWLDDPARVIPLSRAGVPRRTAKDVIDGLRTQLGANDGPRSRPALESDQRFTFGFPYDQHGR